MKLTPWFMNYDFGGRARRAHYWANLFCWWGVFAVLIVAVFLTGAGETSSQSTAAAIAVILIVLVAALLSTIDGLAMVFRRAHDTGKSGWIWLLLLIPLINLLALYWLLIEDSQQGPNKYGPPVKQFYEPPAPAAA